MPLSFWRIFIMIKPHDKLSITATFSGYLNFVHLVLLLFVPELRSEWTDRLSCQHWVLTSKIKHLKWLYITIVYKQPKVGELLLPWILRVNGRSKTMTLEPAFYDSHHQRLATPWKNCKLCSVHCKSPREFSRHLREFHCSKEGGSYVCRYGPNNICPSLPLEGVSDMDYENHIARDHVQAPGRARPGQYHYVTLLVILSASR